MPARNTQAMQYDSVDASKTLVNRVSMKLVKIASTKMVDGDSPKNADGTRKSQPVMDSLPVARDGDPGTGPRETTVRESHTKLNHTLHGDEARRCLAGTVTAAADFFLPPPRREVDENLTRPRADGALRRSAHFLLRQNWRLTPHPQGGLAQRNPPIRITNRTADYASG